MFTTRQAARLVKLSEQRIRTVARVALPSGDQAVSENPDQPTFGFQDLAVLRTAARLISEGLSASRVERALAALRRQLGSQSLSSLQLRVDAGVLVASDGHQAWEPVSGQACFAFGEMKTAEVTQTRNTAKLTDTLGAIFDGPSDMTWFDMAMTLEEADSSGAYDAYLRALTCNPEHVEATINIGRMCSDGGDLKRAAAYFRNAVRIDPTHPVAHFNLAVTLHDLGDWAGAEAAYRAALAHDQGFADAHFNLAALLEQRGQRDEALKHLKAYDDARRDS